MGFRMDVVELEAARHREHTAMYRNAGLRFHHAVEATLRFDPSACPLQCGHVWLSLPAGFGAKIGCGMVAYIKNRK